jgi:hypothetical protein
MNKQQMNNFNNSPYREPERNRVSMWTDWRIVLVFGLIVGFLVGYIIFAGDLIDEMIINDEDELIEESDDLVVSSSLTDRIIVDDQPPTDRVLVKKAVLEDDGWVVIYTDRDGQPDYIIGAQFFAAGTYDDFYTWIENPTTAGNYYHAVLHNDDGYIFETEFGRHVFDLDKDLPVTDSSGNWLSNQFKVVATGSRG